ncbi:MAG: tRNA (5-methylaminomethyl-2-thiouridylate)-methyltransferase [Gammaproteobacteria bacterium]|nr:tRNA (5-methylaminomethyl-2-thiouridylate)-methyltransferase [Gammaproteobacteria bacterium]
MRKAIALISGGLDSLLAAKLIIDQGIYVEGINFFTGFTGDNPNHVLSPDNTKNAAWVAKQLKIKLNIINIVDEFKPVLFNPKYGYGANLNPCLDCKLFMILKAKGWAIEHGFDFLVTGEVLAQRPMSQRKDTLPLAVKLTDDLILRPLSAKLLAITLPEREGWVKRELLCAISGRGRKKQIELAEQFGFKDYPQPAGGCLLTEANFCKRLEEFWQFRGTRDYSLQDIELLKIGRHIYFTPQIRLIVGRNENENRILAELCPDKITLQTKSHPGALVVVDGNPNSEELEKIKQIAVFYSKGKGAENIEVACCNVKIL